MGNKDSLKVSEVQSSLKELEDNIRSCIFGFIEETGIGIRDVDIQFIAMNTSSNKYCKYKISRIAVTLDL